MALHRYVLPMYHLYSYMIWLRPVWSASVRNYFAIGSNMVPSTMTSLRNLSPVSATAAVLPDYRLAFDIEGSQWVEPSAASVQYCPGKLVHGVLYTLDNDSDFQALSTSEGVPFAYRWQACNVILYKGDGDRAGACALEKWRAALSTRPQTSCTDLSIPAVVLMKASRPRVWPFASNDGAPTEQTIDIPPSLSYLEILRRGARLWKMDARYQSELARTKVAPGIVGVSSLSLAIAELWNPREDIDLFPRD